MKRVFHLVLVLLLIPTYFLVAQKRKRELPKPPAFHEEVSSNARAITAPPECIKLVRQFIQYVARPKPDIATDAEAQQRFLSKAMRSAFANHRTLYAEFVKKNDTPDGPPDNGDFVGAWEPPTSFRIIGSRRYYQRAVVDVRFTWGLHTNYEGDTRLTSYSLILEKGFWKLDDIYVFDGAFIPAHSLIENFRREKY